MSEPVNPALPPAVSVIVPVYNTAERLRACIDSLLAQSVADFEIILVNDGSTDESPQICAEYAAKCPERVRYLTGPNGGVCAARNKGLAAARGEWIAFCDSDDLTDRALYQTLLENARRADADISCCALLDRGPEEEKTVTNFPFAGEIVIDNHDEIMRRFFFPLLNGALTCNGYLVTCLFKRSIIEARGIRMPVEVKMREDELFLLEYLLEAQRLAATSQVLYTYLRFEASACTKYYRGRDDFYREQNWYQRACEHRRIFLKGGLPARYPHCYRGLVFREVFHKVQMLSCTPELSLLRRIKAIRAISKEPVWQELTGSRMNCLFRWLIKYAPEVLPALCWAKRKKNQRERERRNPAKESG